MQSVFVIITTLIASNNYFCKGFVCNNFGRDGTGDTSEVATLQHLLIALGHKTLSPTTSKEEPIVVALPFSNGASQVQLRG